MSRSTLTQISLVLVTLVCAATAAAFTIAALMVALVANGLWFFVFMFIASIGYIGAFVAVYELVEVREELAAAEYVRKITA